MTEPTHDFTQLNLYQRIELAQTLLDGIACDLYGAPLSPALRAELDRRVAEIESGAVVPIRWDHAFNQLLGEA